MTDRDHDPGRLLRLAERPRALTDAERTRLQERLAEATPVVDPHDQRVDLLPAKRIHRARRRVGSTVVVVGAGVAAVSILFVVFTVREPVEPTPVVAVTAIANETLPSPASDAEAFCAAQVDAVTNALTRWRGVENWAWAAGTPDLSELVAEALGSASELDDPVLAARASTARDRLAVELAAIDPAMNPRDAVGPTVAAIDAALDSIVDVAGGLSPPCDVEQLETARGDD